MKNFLSTFCGFTIVLFLIVGCFYVNKNSGEKPKESKLYHRSFKYNVECEKKSAEEIECTVKRVFKCRWNPPRKTTPESGLCSPEFASGMKMLADVKYGAMNINKFVPCGTTDKNGKLTVDLRKVIPQYRVEFAPHRIQLLIDDPGISMKRMQDANGVTADSVVSVLDYDQFAEYIKMVKDEESENAVSKEECVLMCKRHEHILGKCVNKETKNECEWCVHNTGQMCRVCMVKCEVYEKRQIEKVCNYHSESYCWQPE